VKNLRGSIAWGSAEAFVALFTAIVVSLAAGRIIGPAAFGLGSLAFLIVSLAETIIAMPFSEALVRRRYWSVRIIDAAFAGAMIAGTAVFLLLFLLAPLFADWLDEPDLTWLIRVQALTCLLLGIRGIPEAVFARKLRFRILSRCNMTAKLVGGSLTIGLALAGFGAWCVVLGNVGFAFVAAVTMLASQSRMPRFRPHWGYTKELTSFGVFSVTDAFLGAATPRVFNVLLGYYYGVVPVGQTSIAFRINDGVGALLAMVTQRLALPILSRVAHDRDRLAAMISQGSRMAFLVTGPVFVGMAFVSADLIAVLLGPGWEGAAIALVAVNIWSLLNFSCVVWGAAVKALGYPGRWVMVQALGLPITGIGTILLASVGLDIHWTLMLWPLFGLAYFTVGALVLHRSGGIAYVDQFRPFMRIGLALLGMGAMLSFIDLEFEIDGIMGLATKIVTGAAVYVTLILLLERRTVMQIVRPNAAQKAI
tara:strand:- start:10844 stop:12280 length:1437 start_codon:yes stop_codon:yes gene_type:complete